MTQAILGIATELQRGNSASPEVFTKIPEVRNLRLPFGEHGDVDVTNFDSPSGYNEYIAGSTEPGEVSFEMNTIPGNATQQALVDDHTARTVRNWRVKYPDDTTYEFLGYVKSLETNPTPKDAIITRGTIKVSGTVELIS